MECPYTWMAHDSVMMLLAKGGKCWLRAAVGTPHCMGHRSVHCGDIVGERCKYECKNRMHEHSLLVLSSMAHWCHQVASSRTGQTFTQLMSSIKQPCTTELKLVQLLGQPVVR
eukprot:TRINITY_DN43925_c0_g1_i1.p1 TRINITY_DN43925_c0_g1~~TRINITY_DN43925_c0_g1_i1.p1  ORF type:complete len:113 (+),score=2.46 TRINITY_DN43925_c0_g1_i1:180-518(+)